MILLKRLTYHVFANNLVPEEQFGFMPGHSSYVAPAYYWRGYISSGIQRKFHWCGFFFLGISKVLDSTWLTGLVYELIHMGISGGDKINRLLSSPRILQVRMDSAVSEWKPMLAGIPQGSTLSPILYLITYAHQIYRNVFKSTYIFMQMTFAFMAKTGVQNLHT